MSTRKGILIGVGLLLLMVAVSELQQLKAQGESDIFREKIPLTDLFGGWLGVFPLDSPGYPGSDYGEGSAGAGFGGGGGEGW